MADFAKAKAIRLDLIAADLEISPLGFRLAYVLAGYINRQTGEAWPTQETLAAKIGATTRSVRTLIEQLAARGHIEVVPARGRGHTNRYRLAPVGREAAAAISEKWKSASAQSTEKPEANFRSSAAFDRNSGAEKPEAHFRQNLLEKNLLEEVISPPTPISGSRLQGTDDHGFEEFWRTYPRKTAKGDARREYLKALKLGTRPGDILRGAMRYAAARTGQEDRFTKFPANWLRGECWNDDPPPPRLEDRATGAAEPARRLTAYDLMLGLDARYQGTAQ